MKSASFFCIILHTSCKCHMNLRIIAHCLYHTFYIYIFYYILLLVHVGSHAKLTRCMDVFVFTIGKDWSCRSFCLSWCKTRSKQVSKTFPELLYCLCIIMLILACFLLTRVSSISLFTMVNCWFEYVVSNMHPQKPKPI